ncbi:hypothetical protein Fcan01_04496 [Folsomia candida]|uniref:Uncharacterized protein n=1 Tax=Folsomia candida TaxID=158441 RepID=A0A226ERK2_FOLCA|nr:hypothetical protein Fcan01_04496 [Folsomia candida]
MVNIFVNRATLVVVLFAFLSEKSASSVPVVKKDAVSFDTPVLQLDHFESPADDHHLSSIIDPIQHEESSPKTVRSIAASANNNMASTADSGMSLLQALTHIQTIAQNSGVNLNSDPGSPQSSVVDVQNQIKRLKEQVELYRMINDMLKAETVVQAQPYSIDTNEGTNNASQAQSVAEVPATSTTTTTTTTRPQSRSPPTPTQKRRQNVRQKQNIVTVQPPVIPTVQPPQFDHFEDERHHLRDYDDDYPHHNNNHHSEYDDARNARPQPNYHDDQYNNYDDYDHHPERNYHHYQDQRPTIPKSGQNIRQRKFKRDN